MDPDKIMTMKEVAEYLKVTYLHVFRHKEMFKFFRVGRCWRTTLRNVQESFK
jgi:hypothetical protein